MAPNEEQDHSWSEAQNEEDALSLDMTAVLVLLTHGAVNTLLLSSLNPYRCLYWNQSSCNAAVLDWLALGHLHVFLLLACLFSKTTTVTDERSLVTLCIGLLVSFLGATVYWMGDALNKPMAILQCVVHAGILATLLYSRHAAANAPQAPPKSPGSPRRQGKTPGSWLSTLAVALLFCLAIIRCYHLVLAATALNTDRTEQAIRQATALSAFQVAWILSRSIQNATASQQQQLASGHALVMFTTLLALASAVGDEEEASLDSEARLYGIGAFCSLVIALLGVY